MREHDKLVCIHVNELLEDGYQHRKARIPGYRPDAILENTEEVVILEVILTSNRVPEDIQFLEDYFQKPVRILKKVYPGGKNFYLSNAIERRLHRHDIGDIPTFVNEAVEKALDMLDLKEDSKE